MKIKKIKFIKYKHFKENHEVIFEEDGNIPNITFLVGDNGSGKTAVLDAIFYIYQTGPEVLREDVFSIDYFIQLSPYESKHVGIDTCDLTIHLVKKPASPIVQTEITESISGNILRVSLLENIKKVIFSTVEINFAKTNLTTVTSKDIDSQPLPRQKSLNLSIAIPQLLIDIANADDIEIAGYMKKNGYTTEPPANVGSRLRRFTTVFHEMFNGSKTYQEIESSSGRKNIIFSDMLGQKVSLNQLSTGEKQIIYRIGDLLKDLGNISGAIILIDEPEISLHPSWQSRIKNILKKTFKDLDIQLIIATHSPYIFQEFDYSNESCVKITPLRDTSESISHWTKNTILQKSTNYISYIAYGVTSLVLHIELYTLLQIQEKKTSITKMEEWLKSTGGGNVQIRKTFSSTTSYQGVAIGDSITETLPTYIRNYCDHGDETARSCQPEELKKSIELMLSLLK